MVAEEAEEEVVERMWLSGDRIGSIIIGRGDR